MDIEYDETQDIAAMETEPSGPATPPAPQVEIPEALCADQALLIGPAGTGKTYLARAMTTQLPGTILAATTGIAAINLGEGTTINALLGYYDTESLRDLAISGRLTSKLTKLYRAGIRRIVLDEISMMDAEQLTHIARACDELAGKGYVTDVARDDEIAAAQDDEQDYTPDGARAWPVKLVLTGDFAQLPPVKAEFAFQSAEWERFGANQTQLTKYWRQADPQFIEALTAARRGDGRIVAEYFASKMHPTADIHFEGSTILAKNDEVDRYNMLRMDQLKVAPKVYSATRWGTQRGDWKQIPDRLALKVGALVMILANVREPSLDPGGLPGRLIYANGDLGVVEALAENRAHVTLHRNGQTVDVGMVCRDNWVPMEVGRRKVLKAEGKEHLISDDGKFECTGQVTYLPLRVAYGTTVHKSQGLSLDAVQIDIRAGFFKTPGMVYVALSRCRTAEGLRLVGSPDSLAARCTVHSLVRPWL